VTGQVAMPLEGSPLHLVGPVVLAAALAGIGVYGLLARRNAVLVLIGAELLLNGVNVLLVTVAAMPAGGLAAMAASPNPVLAGQAAVRRGEPHQHLLAGLHGEVTDREVLPGVVQRVEEDLGLVLVGPHVVADLRRPQLSALVALADREDLDDRRVGGGDRVDLGGHLGVGVVTRVLRREVARERRPDGRAEQRQREQGCGGESVGNGQVGAATVASCHLRRVRGGGARAQPDGRAPGEGTNLSGPAVDWQRAAAICDWLLRG